MNNFLFFIITGIILVVLLSVFKIDDINADETKLIQYEGYIVTDKIENAIFGNLIMCRKDTLEYQFFCEDIIYEKYCIGDTL